jgi:hypothetical protein
MKRLLSITIAGLFISGIAAAQVADDPNNNAVNASSQTRGAVGAVLGTSPIDATFATPVGLEHDGSGALDITDISSTSLGVIDTAGALVAGPSALTNTVNPIGVTTIGGNFAVTDTGDIDVDIYDSGYNYISSFDVTAETTFPEGITTAPFSGNFYVVNGSGENIVAEYDAAGTLVTTYPVNGSSQDGIAFDNVRCVFWIYDSGTDLVRSYDSGFNEIENFPGTAAAGSSGGEGVAVIGNSLFVVATGAGELVEFDISGATPAANANELCMLETQPVPTMNRMGLLLLVLTMLGAAVVVRARFN